ncbi:hypothetical protein BU24DRAFT_483247 [Aaosphaeria arxii CBS 175.79]|uniref:Uncharacterized protein n=1 Tax=Aaosphaeria arxii CBS 175.79 TaxID=1450172 RepID=A0A6A5XKU9_9PLEO|nr:uncharacterized protein BU24DRAFT_483247 [Aaosphaeria arxii CBS 175.79]KAF2013479.1 hypothetical protein BU24DRAFT_483247 [Aaosphaeria arxii CBS 175.79]
MTCFRCRVLSLLGYINSEDPCLHRTPSAIELHGFLHSTFIISTQFHSKKLTITMRFTVVVASLIGLAPFVAGIPAEARQESGLPPPNPVVGSVTEFLFDKCSWHPSGTHVSLQTDLGSCRQFNNEQIRSIRYYIEPKGCKIILFKDKNCQDQSIKFEPIRGPEGENDCMALPNYLWNSYQIVDCEFE